MTQKIIVLTGASGFVGRATLAVLSAHGARLRAVSRHPPKVDGLVPNVEWRQADLAAVRGWDEVVDGADAVVHLAGLRGDASEGALMRMNGEATGRLASLAAKSGVKRFVYASSARVYGFARSIDAGTAPDPADLYGRSKLAGEEALMAVADGMGCSVLRSPFVYGADRVGLLGLLIFAARHHVPLPVASLKNRRSLIFAANLADLLAAAALEPTGQNYRLPVGEGGDWTYEAMLRKFAELQGRKAVVLPMPASLIRVGLSAVMTRDTVRRMLDDCVIDPSAIRSRLGWTPPVGTDEAFRLLLRRPAKSGGLQG